MSNATKKPSDAAVDSGLCQLSLVEHALCPLDNRESGTAAGIRHDTRYQFTDRTGERRTATVRVSCPLGLTPTDEFYLWGLLALTLSQPKPSAEFHATPHYCLRQLGVIDQHHRRGGRQYRQFAESLSRLSAVNYQNDGVYDPLRREHRRVSFWFLSYSLPLTNDSSRAWRFVWDGVFLEMAAAFGGHLRFDLSVFRELDPASRRLFLLVCKLFRRQRTTPRFDVHHLGVHVMGFAPTLAIRDLKVKVVRAVQRLRHHGVVSDAVFTRPAASSRSNIPRVMLTRGDYFRKKRSSGATTVESPLAELMRSIELSERMIQTCLRTYPSALLQQWLDITLAARERHGPAFFRRSPAAYFVDNVRNAAKGTRTPPDWWHDLQKHERLTQAKNGRRKRTQESASTDPEPLASLIEAVFEQFVGAAQPEGVARMNAQQFAEESRTRSSKVDPLTLLKLLK